MTEKKADHEEKMKMQQIRSNIAAAWKKRATTRLKQDVLTWPEEAATINYNGFTDLHLSLIRMENAIEQVASKQQTLRWSDIVQKMWKNYCHKCYKFAKRKILIEKNIRFKKRMQKIHHRAFVIQTEHKNPQKEIEEEKATPSPCPFCLEVKVQKEEEVRKKEEEVRKKQALVSCMMTAKRAMQEIEIATGTRAEAASTQRDADTAARCAYRSDHATAGGPSHGGDMIARTDAEKAEEAAGRRGNKRCFRIFPVRLVWPVSAALATSVKKTHIALDAWFNSFENETAEAKMKLAAKMKAETASAGVEVTKALEATAALAQKFAVFEGYRTATWEGNAKKRYKNSAETYKKNLGARWERRAEGFERLGAAINKAAIASDVVKVAAEKAHKTTLTALAGLKKCS